MRWEPLRVEQREKSNPQWASNEDAHQKPRGQDAAEREEIIAQPRELWTRFFLIRNKSGGNIISDKCWIQTLKRNFIRSNPCRYFNSILSFCNSWAIKKTYKRFFLWQPLYCRHIINTTTMPPNPNTVHLIGMWITTDIHTYTHCILTISKPIWNLNK